MEQKKYLKDVLPRLYDETVDWLRSIDRDDLLTQMPHLLVTGRCRCGGCSDFDLDSEIPKLSRASGSTLVHRPLSYAMDNGFSLGLSGADGWAVGEHVESYVSAYELNGSDYEDRYVHKQLELHGFFCEKPDDTSKA